MVKSAELNFLWYDKDDVGVQDDPFTEAEITDNGESEVDDYDVGALILLLIWSFHTSILSSLATNRDKWLQAFLNACFQQLLYSFMGEPS